MKKRKFLSIVAAAALLSFSTTVYAKEYSEKEIDNKIISFSNNLMKKWENRGLTIKKVAIINKAKVIGVKDFKGYVMEFDMNFVIAGQKKEKILTDIFFVSKEGVIATNIFGIDGENLIKKTKFNMNEEEFYNDELFMAGNKNAKIKVVVFSDVFCPYCRKKFPKLKKEIMDNKDNAGLYMIDLPLEEIHPSSKLVSAVMIQAESKGDKKIREKLYSIDLSPIAKTNDESKIVKFIEKQTGYKADISTLPEYKKQIDKYVKMARKLAIEKTPSMVINGRHASFEDLTKLLSKLSKDKDNRNSQTSSDNSSSNNTN